MKVGDRIGAYRVLRRLGAGGMGEVYEAEGGDGAHVALKLFAADGAKADFFRRRFLVEARLLSRLSHPRLVKMHDFGVDEATERPYLAMDLVLRADGCAKTLAEVTPNEADEAQLALWFRDLASVIDYIHAEGVVHRDIKLNNVLVDSAGCAVLTDFGLGILEGAGGLFGYGAEDDSEEPPPNPLYPAPMENGALYFGGTDCGRFIPETLVLNDGVRPDVAVITQNALADGNYMAVIRERYGKRYAIPSEGELTDAFREFVEGVQSGRIDAHDAVEIKDGRVTVTGTLAVMKINEILAKKLFEKNKGQHAMYVEESYPIEWMYDYMAPHGLVMKLNAEKPGAVSDEEVRDNDEFWDWMVKRLLSSEQFASRRAEHWRRTADGELDPDHRMGVRAFAKLRLTHAKLYARQAKNPIAFARAIRQAIAIDPQDKETCINYAAFLKANKLGTAREDFLGCLKKLGVDTDGWR